MEYKEQIPGDFFTVFHSKIRFNENNKGN